MQKEKLKKIIEKTPELFPKDIEEAIYQGKIKLGMNPYQAQLAGGSCSFEVQVDHKVWGKNADPIKVIKEQTYNPDDSKIILNFKNSTQFSDKSEQTFYVKFEQGKVISIDKEKKDV